MKLLLSLILAVATFFSSLAAAVFPQASGQTAEKEDAVPAMSQSYSITEAAPSVWNTEDASGAAAAADIDYADMEYVRCDADGFYADADALRAAADEGDADTVCALSQTLYNEFLYMDTMASLCFLKHSADIYDEYWTDEYAYMNTLWSEMSDELYNACSYALNSACGEAFAAYLGEDAALYFSDYDPLTDEDVARSERELELIDEYYALYDTIYDISYSWNGEDWTLAMLYGSDGDRLDYGSYLEVYYGLQQALCESFAPTYIELVGLRQEEARSYGYDSYIDYAYECVYYRDYTPEDAQALCDAIKPIAREYYADFYYSDLAYASESVSPVMDTEQLVATLGKYLPEIDPSLYDAWEYLTGHGLYDLEPSSSGRFDGGFSLSLNYYGSAFIYDSRSETCYDFMTLTHEFGHFCNFYYNPLPNIVLWVDDLDLSEIHSNGLQALFTAFYDDIYGGDSYIAEFTNLTNLLENIIDGCVYDEFQRRVYEYGGELTAEVLNAIHMEVCAEYGIYDGYDQAPVWDSTWVYISHNFEAPFYYISYAASAIAALQIWDISQSDFQAAVNVYMDILGHGAYESTYSAVLEDCGLALFTEEGVAEDVCRPVLDQLAALDRTSRWR